MNTRIFKLSMLAIFCIGAVASNAQSNLPEETINVVKKLKVVDTKGLSAEESETVVNILNQIKKQHSEDFVEITAVGVDNAPKAAKPALASIPKNSKAKLGSESNKIVVDMTSGVGVRQLAPNRKKFMLDGHEVSGEEFSKVMYMRGKEGCKLRTCRSKDSLAKYNAQGYDELWILETVKAKEPTAKTPAPAVKAAEPANKNEARVGTKENPMDISMLLTSGKQVRAKYILDGREITSSEYWDISMIRGNVGAKYKTFRDKESLAKYNAQGYDEVHIMETVKVEKSTTPRVTKFKQKGNQVSFRIEVPKSAEHAKQKVDIEYEFPVEM